MLKRTAGRVSRLAEMIPVHVAVERSTKSVVADNTIIPLMLEMQTLITHLYGNNMEVDGQAAMHPK